MTRTALSCLGTWVVAALGAAAAAEPPGLPMGDGHVSVGDPVQVENLTVFPVYGREQPRLANVVSLERAQVTGKVKVRERDAGGSVGTLVVENHGSEDVLILAGTVIKGGNQDRQIGEDLVVAPGKSVPVDAFCVEHGRWSGRRQGVATAGEFKATRALAPHKVRAAGQYEANQRKVWDQVASVNAANDKRSDTGTLMATYDDTQLVSKREEMAGRVEKALSKVPGGTSVVGVAYAVSGHIRGARWFATHALYAQHRDQLVRTAAMEALTAQAQGASRGAAVTPQHVRDFVSEIRRAAVAEKKKTRSLNENRLRKTPVGYSSEAVIEKDRGEVAVTVDVLAAD